MKHYKSFKEAVAVLKGNVEKACMEKEEIIKKDSKEDKTAKNKVVEENKKNEDKN